MKKTFVFTARGNLQDFARITSVLAEDYNVVPRSRGEVIAQAIHILSEIFRSKDKGIPFPTPEDAEAYLQSVGLDSLRSRRSLMNDATEKIIEEGGFEIGKKDPIELLKKARGDK